MTIFFASIYKSLAGDAKPLTTLDESKRITPPTHVIVGTKDLLGEKNFQKAEGLFGQQLEIKSYQMGHFPSPENLEKIDTDIRAFLKKHY